MAEYLNVKLKTGQDVVGVLQDTGEDFVVLVNPVEFGFDPKDGLYAKTWMMLSTEKTAVFYRSDSHYINIANDKAINYYESFLERMHQFDNSEGLDEAPQKEYNDSEVEEILSSLEEAYLSTKH